MAYFAPVAGIQSVKKYAPIEKHQGLELVQFAMQQLELSLTSQSGALDTPREAMNHETCKGLRWI